MRSIGLILLLILLVGGIWVLYAPKDVAEKSVQDSNVSISSRAVFVFDGISVADDIEILDLSNQGLSGSLRAEIRELRNLTVLDISGNNFTGLPAEIGQLTQLEILNVANNPLTGLPHELGNLQNLQVLDLVGTNYSSYDLEIIKSRLPDDVKVLTD